MKSIAAAFLFVAAAAFAQGPTGADVKPSDGAIKGGSIPTPAKPAARRCDDLSGTLREQCLEQERKPATGATRAPGEPPPQNPRKEKPPR